MIKLGWRILANPSSLFARFFKHRYFKNSYIWETKYKSYSSYAWKGIWLGLSHLKYNIRWVIGDGWLVDFWADPWLSERSIWDSYGTTIHQDLEIAMPKVFDYIGGHLQSSVFPTTTSGFLTQIWQEVERFIIPLQPHKDILVWIHSASGLFSTKEAWEFIRNKGTTQSIFKALWSSKCHPREKWFSWLALHERLPMISLLQQWGIAMAPPVCLFCKNSDDSPYHLLFLCDFSQAVWRSLAWHCGKRFISGSSIPSMLRSSLSFRFKSHGSLIFGLLYCSQLFGFYGRSAIEIRINQEGTSASTNNFPMFGS
ncbi:hypothetical protein AMTRI_Chr04g247120 [Amborella trichopoda]